MTGCDQSMAIPQLLADVTTCSFGERSDSLLNYRRKLACGTNESPDLDPQLLTIHDMDREEGAPIGFVVEPQVLNAVEEYFPADGLIQHASTPFFEQ